MTENVSHDPMVNPYDTKPDTQVVRFDWAIKYFLRNKAHFDVLEGFLSELLQLDVHIIEILESEVSPDAPYTKLSRVDVLATTPIGKVIIEVQVDRQYDFLSRVLYSTSKTIVDYLKKGDDYHQVQKVYSVSVLYFDLGQGSDYLYKGITEFKGVHTHEPLTLNPKEQAIYQHQVHSPSDIFPEYYLIKVNQFRDSIKEKLDEWIYFFKHETVKPSFSAQGIQVAAEKLAVVNMAPDKRAAYDRYLQDLSYEASMFHSSFHDGKLEGIIQGKQEGIIQGIQEGIIQGIQEGIIQGKMEMANRLKAKGYPLQDIADITGLSLSDIQSL